MASQGDATAIAALQRFARAGHPVNSKNREHVRAYLLAKQSNARPRAETVLAILSNASSVSTGGVKLSSDFILVPKINFADIAEGPPWLQEWIVTESELRSTYNVPEDTDFSGFFVCDGSTPIARLGKRLKKISFEESATKMLTTSGVLGWPMKTQSRFRQRRPCPDIRPL